jgi:hypothetical protein
MEEHKKRTNIQSRDNKVQKLKGGKKAFAQIEKPSLGPKSFISSMKQIKQRERKES